jgi:hypothetical protein
MLCEPCTFPCETCDPYNGTSCTTCNGIYKLIDDSCICNEEAGYYIDDLDCNACSPTCTKCTIEPEYCSECKTECGYFLAENECVKCDCGEFESPDCGDCVCSVTPVGFTVKSFRRECPVNKVCFKVQFYDFEDVSKDLSGSKVNEEYKDSFFRIVDTTPDEVSHTFHIRNGFRLHVHAAHNITELGNFIISPNNYTLSV